MKSPHPAPDLLRALDEDVLPDDVARDVRAHLESCRICVQLREDLLHTSLSEPSLGEVTRLRRRILGGSSRPRARYLAVAAALAALALIGLWRFRPDTEGPARPVEIAKQAPVEYRLNVETAPLRLPLGAIVIRGSQVGPEERYLKELGAALEPYRSGRYGEAVMHLRWLGARYPRAVEPPFYQGVAQLLNGDAKSSVAELERARQIGGEALNDDIQWYLAAALERTGGWDRATQLLEKLCAGDSVHRQAACAGIGRK